MPTHFLRGFVVPYAVVWLAAAVAGELLSAVLCAVVARKPAELERRITRACKTLGGVFFGSGIVGAISRLAVFASVTAGGRLGQSLGTRMWSNAVIDAGFNLVFGVFLAAPPLALSLIVADRVKRLPD